MEPPQVTELPQVLEPPAHVWTTAQDIGDPTETWENNQVLEPPQFLESSQDLDFTDMVEPSVDASIRHDGSQVEDEPELEKKIRKRVDCPRCGLNVQ